MEWSVLDWNESAIGFYRAIGAVPMDAWTVYRLTGDALNRLANGEEHAKSTKTVLTTKDMKGTKKREHK